MGFTTDIADYPEGIVLAVDKPYRWTSADVIRKLKYAAIRHFRKKNLKVGHAGTLDPLATGVLLVCIGPACKRAQELQDHDKEYIARIRFGATTPSYDLEKEVDRTFPYAHITRAEVEAALPAFLGEQEQVAPLFSAKSVDGVRAYELARKLYRSGRMAELDDTALETLHRSRITISELELLDFVEAESSVLPEASASLRSAPAPPTVSCVPSELVSSGPLPLPRSGGGQASGRVSPSSDSSYWYFRIAADRFLRNMVRATVGTLIEVGRGKHDPEWVAELIKYGSRGDAGESVPGNALFLNKVDY